MSTAIQIVVLVVIGLNLSFVLRDTVRHSHHRTDYLRVLRGLSPRYFALAIPALAAVGTTAWLLCQLPILSWGWWQALGGSGNAAFGSTGRSDSVGLVITLVMTGVLTLAMPLLALSEERSFRRGAEQRSRRAILGNSVLFGLIHLVMGIPIGVALALTIGGLYFTWAYLRAYRQAGGVGIVRVADAAPEVLDEQIREALDIEKARIDSALFAAASAHLAYNWTVVGLFGLALAASLA